MDVEVKRSTVDGGAAGRGLFALKDFEPGDMVVSVDRPYVAELDVDRMPTTCAWCFQRGSSSPEERRIDKALGLPSANIETKACGGCKKVRYCSKSCQTKSWKAEHKYECKAVGVQGRPDLPNGVRAVIKLLGKFEADDNTESDVVEILRFKPASDQKVMDTIKEYAAQRYDDYAMLGYGAWKYAGEPTLKDMDLQGAAVVLFFNIMSNTLQLSSALDDAQLGIGFDPVICSANHSCEPNTVSIFNQPQFLLRAIKPIKKGDEIFIKYVDVSNPFSIRQAELHDAYFFRCGCAKCKKGAKWAEDNFLKKPEELGPEHCRVADNLIKRHESQLPKFFVPANDATAQRRVAAIQAEAFSVSGTTFDGNKGNENASEEEIKDALKLTINSGLWPITRQPVPHLLRQLLVHYLSDQRFYRAWRCGLKMHFETGPVLHPAKFYPDKIVDCWMMATVTTQLCNPNFGDHRQIFQDSLKAGLDLRIVSLGFMLEARDNMDKAYGRDSHFGRVVENMYRMADAQMGIDKLRKQVKEVWPKLEVMAKSIPVVEL